MTKIVVHTFTVGDVEDPSLYAGGPLYEWQQSEAGQWVLDHANEPPYWQQSISALTWGHVFAVIANLSDTDATYYRLKWGIK